MADAFSPPPPTGANANRVRHAMAFTASGRYINLVVNFAATAALARLLTPAEVGLAMIGTSLVAIPEAFNEFGILNYVIQKHGLTRLNARAAFTVGLLIAVSLTVLTWSAATLASSFYGKPALAHYLHIIVLGFLISPFLAPLTALLKRDLAFGRATLIAVSGTLVNTATVIALAALGFGFMSVAWGALASGIVSVATAAALSPNFWVFRPTFRGLGEVLHFGGFASVAVLCGRAAALMPYLIFGRLLPASAAGLYSRAVVICELPDKGVFSALLPVALPALAAEARRGADLKPHFLRAVVYVTGVQLPILACLVLLAHPIVLVLLGGQWTAAVPLVQLMAGAAVFSFPMILAFPMFVALGRIAEAPVASLVVLPVAVPLIYAAALLGVEAATATLFVTVPLQGLVTLVQLRRGVRFRWRELGAAIAPSLIVGLAAAVPPLVAIALAGFSFALPRSVMVVAGAAAVLAWVVALRLTGHPLYTEVARAGRTLAELGAAGRARLHRGAA
jgi:O-antigen/teichoic acid export membrane protein